MTLENRVFAIGRPSGISQRDRGLAERVEEAVDRMSEEASTDRSRLLLGILTYCYALGIYSSGEIENAIVSDANADSIYALAFQNAAPAVALRTFRRANREVILRCLASVLDGPDPVTDATERVRVAIEADSIALDF